MKRILVVLVVILSFFWFVSLTNAQNRLNIEFQLNPDQEEIISRTSKAVIGDNFVIRNFTTEFLLDKDRSVIVKEKITVDFFTEKHGIFRIIPDRYKLKNQTLITPLSIISITDENDKKIPYEKDHYNDSIRLKIGDPDKTINGRHTYNIDYRVKRILQEYDDHLEFYWNVTGHEWPTGIENAVAIIESPHAGIVKTTCFAGPLGNTEENCQFKEKDNTVKFVSPISINPGEDFTIVVGFNKKNNLQSPGLLDEVYFFIFDNWGYLFAVLPFFLAFILWWFLGRDKSYLFGNVFYKPENAREADVSPFSHPHLPMVYGPIDGLTPSQIGAIYDERVDMQDIVAEIIELARLKVLTIKKQETKKLFGNKTEYIFTKMIKTNAKLQPYQEKILQAIFSSKNTVKLSELKNKFYLSLEGIKKAIYDSLIKDGIFPYNPTTAKALSGGLYFALDVGSFILIAVYTDVTANFWPMLIFFPLTAIGFRFALAMARRTAWGHSLFRQTVGLKWYLERGKWREEIAEKNLFFQEILPLAISLGVVEQLAKDMKDLGINPPEYFAVGSVGTFSRDLNSFSSATSSSLSSSPSGSSSWSGGSGFSGGSSGGGGGGGGGGSW